MVLSDYIRGRDNNFNLIRFIAALAVLVSHGFALTTGDEGAEPLRRQLNMPLGSMAVDVFFLTSGFLVSASLIARQNAVEFICARALRIYPALWVMLAFLTFALGAMLTELPLGAYLSSPQTWSYVAHAGTLVAGIEHWLPQVFTSNPIGPSVNGSLWTLPYEVGMYGLLLGAWLLFSPLPRLQLTLLKRTIVALAVGAGAFIVVGYFRHGLPDSFELHRTYRFPSLLFMFFCGGSFYVLRDKIRMSGAACLALGALLLASTVNKHVFYVAYIVATPYLLFYLAYVPAGLVRRFNDVGDYSYGIYIYAFPVQQTIVHLDPQLSVAASTAACVVVTLMLSMLSWHCIEKTALKFKTALSRRLQRRPMAAGALNS
ncbi:MAG TPA: acyltransferase [Roseateles sp.]